LEESNDKGLLEIKTFNANATPAFDIANFDAYCKSILKQPERLDADYLIISYKMIDSKLAIDNVWLKKVWEIAGTSETNIVHLQIKNKKIDNIRPVEWLNYSSKIKNKPFTSILNFITEISKVHNAYSQCDTYKEKWLETVKENYFKKTGIKL
jgi:type II restriction enzyme